MKRLCSRASLPSKFASLAGTLPILAAQMDPGQPWAACTILFPAAELLLYKAHLFTCKGQRRGEDTKEGLGREA